MYVLLKKYMLLRENFDNCAISNMTSSIVSVKRKTWAIALNLAQNTLSACNSDQTTGV